ncbi:MAG TPA: ComEC/Rec2 family competence protein [Rectinemataceae bacterium]|nr:ComEC/Rec2 family competence protein [Rectinemataceae bacterium]
MEMKIFSDAKGRKRPDRASREDRAEESGKRRRGKRDASYARGFGAVLSFALARQAPVLWTALGAALVFYGCPSRLRVVLLLALAAAGVSLTLRQSGPSRSRGVAVIGIAFSLGLAWGAAAALAETARAQPGELSRFPIGGFSGTVAADGRRTSKGNSIMTIELREITLTSPGWRARIAWPRGRPLCLLVTDSTGEFPAGRKIRVDRPSVIDAGQALYYASAKDIVLGAFVSKIAGFRSEARSALSARIAAVSGAAFPLARALLLGIMDDIENEESRLFRDAGCAHILSLSGQHLSILCSLMTLLFAKMLKRADIADAASLMFALFFTWLAGAGPSLLRSALMTLSTLILRRIDRPQRGIAVLSLVFCLALGWKSAEARSLSFTLSYAAMIGLTLLSARWENLLWRVPGILAKPLSASFAALCATAGISLSTFGFFALGGIVASTLSGPVVLLFMWSLLGGTLVGCFLPFLNTALSRWHELLHEAILLIMRIGAILPSIRPEGEVRKLLLSLAIVALSLFVYAYPYGEYALNRLAGARRPGAFSLGKP